METSKLMSHRKTLLLTIFFGGFFVVAAFSLFAPTLSHAAACGPVQVLLPTDFSCTTSLPLICDGGISDSCEDLSLPGTFIDYDYCEIIGGSYFCLPVILDVTVTPQPTSIGLEPFNPNFNVVVTGADDPSITPIIYEADCTSDGPNEFSLTVGSASLIMAGPCAADYSTAGPYTARITVSQGANTAFVDVAILVTGNTAPVVTILTPPSTITLPSTLNLSATETDDGLPTPPFVALLWTSSGPGVVTFTPSNSLNSVATFPTAGVYTLTLTGDDGLLTGSDSVVVTVNGGGAFTVGAIPQPGSIGTVPFNPNFDVTVNGATDPSITPISYEINCTSDAGPPDFAFTIGSNTFFMVGACAADYSTANTYTARITVSQGVKTAFVDVPITVNTGGGAFDITPSTLNCGTTVVGTPTTCSGGFQAVNPTGAPVTISSVVTDNAEFTLGFGPVTILAGTTVPLPITFNATTPGSHNGTITFTTTGPIVRSITGTANPPGGGGGCTPACVAPDVCVAGACVPPGGGGGPGPTIVNFPNPLGTTTFTGLINNIINFLFSIAVIVAPILLVIAGIIFMTAAGDPTRVSTARRMLLWTIVGFGIILISKGLVTLLQNILGLGGP